MRISDWSSDVCSSDLPVHDEARGHPGDGLDLHQVVGLQGRAGGDQVDDAPAQAQARRQLHGAVQLDALRLHAARGEVPTCDAGILGGDADVAPTAGIVALGEAPRRRSEEHTSELQSLMRISYAVFCLKKKMTTLKQ